MDINQIKSYFKQVIEYSQGISDPQIDDLFLNWSVAKSKFIKAFGDKLIYTYPKKMRFELNEEEKNDKVKIFCEKISNIYENYDLKDFILTFIDDFYNNITSKDYFYKGNIIPKGSKIVKSFKFFEEDKCLLTDLQNEASRIIQEDKIEGYLCLSIHPLDFLSLSENNCNWRSCHALDGDYRSGNLSYMVDTSTIICYLRSTEKENITRFPFKWYNKKWRVLLFFSDDFQMLFAGKQYPFTNNKILDFIKDKLIKKSNIIHTRWTSWDNFYITEYYKDDIKNYLDDRYIPIKTRLIGMSDLIIQNDFSLNFNDLLDSHTYIPMYSFNKDNLAHYKHTRFYIGKQVKCLKCGISVLTRSDQMQCPLCDQVYGIPYTYEEDDANIMGYCCNCNRPIDIDESFGLNSENNEMICKDCLDNYFVICNRCGLYCLQNELVYNEELDDFICLTCNEELQSKKGE